MLRNELWKSDRIPDNVVLYPLADAAHLSILYCLHVMKFPQYHVPWTETEYQLCAVKKGPNFPLSFYVMAKSIIYPSAFQVWQETMRFSDCERPGGMPQLLDSM